MKKRRLMQARIIGFLRLTRAGVAVKELCRKHGISDAAFCGWGAKYGVGLRPHVCELIAALRDGGNRPRLARSWPGGGLFGEGCNEPVGKAGVTMSENCSRQS